MTDAEIGPLANELRWSPQLVLFLTFASFYFAIGPGNFFAVDEVMQQETAQALILRRTLDVPAIVDTRLGRGQSWYTVKGAGLPLAALPFVYVGLKLDDAFGSMNGGPLAGPPLGMEDQPLRGGRLAISAALIFNALVGGAIIAALFMLGTRLSGNPRAALLMAIAAGVATIVMSEATHFYQHLLDALMLILAFWFFSGREIRALERRALFGGLALGVAIMARPDAGPSAVVIWLYGAIAAWMLARNLPDRMPRTIRRTLLAAAGPAAAVAGCLYFNYLRFGGFTQFGYTKDREHFVLDAVQIAKAIAGYLVSPALSIFLFAPPLIFALAAGHRAYRRWPLETTALLLAAVAHLLLISTWRVWHGDLSYGPRFMTDAIVLLMPLTLPAFQAAVDFRSRLSVFAVGGLILLGFVVQLIGVAVNVAVNEWDRKATGLVDNGAWVFVAAVSPIVCDLKELAAARNLSPWAIRALTHPGWALVLFFGLTTVAVIGGRLMLQYFRAPDSELAKITSDGLPITLVVAAVIPICAGFALVRPLTEGPSEHVFAMMEAGLSAQRAGEVVTAEEDYAIVLSLDPSNKFAHYDLGILQQDAGRNGEAMALYVKALNEDPSFDRARQRIIALESALRPASPAK